MGRRFVTGGTLYDFENLDSGSRITVPSTTTILKVWPAPELGDWKLRQVAKAWRDGRKIPPHRSTLTGLVKEAVPTRARDRGIEAHLQLEVSYDFAQRGAGVREFWEPVISRIREVIDEVIDVKLTEVPVLNASEGWAGTADLIGRCRITNRPVIADLKTGGRIWASHFGQIAAYAAAEGILVGNEYHQIGTDSQNWLLCFVHAPLSGSQDRPKLKEDPRIVWLTAPQIEYGHEMFRLSRQVFNLADLNWRELEADWQNRYLDYDPKG